MESQFLLYMKSQIVTFLMAILVYLDILMVLKLGKNILIFVLSLSSAEFVTASGVPWVSGAQGKK